MRSFYQTCYAVGVINLDNQWQCLYVRQAWAKITSAFAYLLHYTACRLCYVPLRVNNVSVAYIQQSVDQTGAHVLPTSNNPSLHISLVTN